MIPVQNQHVRQVCRAENSRCLFYYKILSAFTSFRMDSPPDPLKYKLKYSLGVQGPFVPNQVRANKFEQDAPAKGV
jgi:hypothetical protein